MMGLKKPFCVATAIKGFLMRFCLPEAIYVTDLFLNQDKIGISCSFFGSFTVYSGWESPFF
jgi:hypothetical protein